VAGPSIAIVGGGVMGCAVAFALARGGARVRVFERDHLGVPIAEVQHDLRVTGYVRREVQKDRKKPGDQHQPAQTPTVTRQPSVHRRA